MYLQISVSRQDFNMGVNGVVLEAGDILEVGDVLEVGVVFRNGDLRPGLY
jgi:hypothetical protein